jgi:ketosteroid isomerase-like protein
MRCYAVVEPAFPSLVAAMALAIAACRTGPSFDSAAETRAVAQAIDGTIGWAKTKDFERLYGIIADDSAYLEVHPDDGVVRGIAEFRELETIWASPDFRAIRYEIRDLRISFSRSGDVAWFFCMLDDVNEWKGQPASWINTRWTGVLEKREGRWRMVQMHFSHPVE